MRDSRWMRLVLGAGLAVACSACTGPHGQVRTDPARTGDRRPATGDGPGTVDRGPTQSIDFGFPFSKHDEDDRETVTFDIGRLFY